MSDSMRLKIGFFRVHSRLDFHFGHNAISFWNALTNASAGTMCSNSIDFDLEDFGFLGIYPHEFLSIFLFAQ